nr:hypothetical protein [Tanacetum cinerariifolium]
MVNKLGFKTIKVQDGVVIKKRNLMQGIQIWLLRDSPAEEAKTESNVWDDESEDVNPFCEENPGFHDDHYDNPLKETESEPIIWDIGDEEEEKNDLLEKEDLVEKKTT